jgi:hypothetical protein
LTLALGAVMIDCVHVTTHDSNRSDRIASPKG